MGNTVRLGEQTADRADYATHLQKRGQNHALESAVRKNAWTANQTFAVILTTSIESSESALGDFRNPRESHFDMFVVHLPLVRRLIEVGKHKKKPYDEEENSPRATKNELQLALTACRIAAHSIISLR